MTQTLRNKKRSRMQRAWQAYKAGLDDGKANTKRTVVLNARTARDYRRGFAKGEAARLAEEQSKTIFVKLWRVICRKK